MEASQAALRDTVPRCFWTDRPGAPDPREPLTGAVTADLVVVGGGFTGLWTALLAKERDPRTDVVVLEARTLAQSASCRSGGFISESLTHGLEEGATRWPQELEELLLMGQENMAATAAFVWSHDIAADLRLVGRTVCAVRPHEVARLQTSARLHEQHGESAVFLSREEVQSDIHSPTYLAGLRVRSGGGLVDPVALNWGLQHVAKRLDVRVHENSRVIAAEAEGGRIRVVTPDGAAIAPHVVVAANTCVGPLGRLERRVFPVHDHVLVTEPLSSEQLDSIGWHENQGLTSAGRRVQYSRRTPDDRILWGGFHAPHHVGSTGSHASDRHEVFHRRLADTFFTTFPQLTGVRFTHRWTGVSDLIGPFAHRFGAAGGGRVVYATGFTGVDVGSSRFAASTLLDLLAGVETRRTRLSMVLRRPTSLPPVSSRR